MVWQWLFPWMVDDDAKPEKPKKLKINIDRISADIAAIDLTNGAGFVVNSFWLTETPEWFLRWLEKQSINEGENLT